ncbi:exosortase/archaeosortase family protein [Planctomycetota bacterium]
MDSKTVRTLTERIKAVSLHIPRKNGCHACAEVREQDGRVGFFMSILILIIIAVWSCWPTIMSLYLGWQGNDYSAGQLVPMVFVFLFWRDRKALRECQLTPCWVQGLALLLFAYGIWLFGFLAGRVTIERYSLVLTLAGLILLVTGQQFFKRVFWIWLFLFLMVPLPGRVHSMISPPLQHMATSGAVFLLEAFGIHVTQQGNTVVLNGDMHIAVAEACSGLRMLTAFVIVAAFIAFMIKRPRWQKVVILLSSIPVAVVCNVIRIFATAVLMLHVNAEVAQTFFHDFAGYVMMPVAVMILFGELWLMDKAVVPDTLESRSRGGKKKDVIVRKQ